jgi:hypothetical protein
MNKRIKNKIIKKKNTERIDSILRKIRESYTLKDRVFKHGYFFFYTGRNSVCHFRLKETPYWKYGIWLNNEGFAIFGEHEELIDKFKPSRTYLSYKSDLQNFISKVKDISLQPDLHFVNSLTFGNAEVDFKKIEEGNETWYKGYQVVREFNKETKLWDIIHRDETITQCEYVNKKYKEYFASKEEQCENERADQLYAFRFFKDLPNMFDEIIGVGVKDGNKKGYWSSPRYKFLIVVKPDITRERVTTLYDEIDNLVYDKHKSEEKRTLEHQFELFGIYNSLNDIKKCDYKYLA